VKKMERERERGALSSGGGRSLKMWLFRAVGQQSGEWVGCFRWWRCAGAQGGCWTTLGMEAILPAPQGEHEMLAR
jgi:hypothetical protein